MINGHDYDFQEHDHLGFASGGMVKVEEFPFDLVDRRLLAGKVQPTEPPTNDYRETAYREAALKLLPVLDQILSFVMTYDNPRLACWVAALALGRNSLVDGASQQDLADKFSVTKAAINKCCKALQARLGNSIDGIEPMGGQRKIESCRKFAHVRNQQINHHTKPKHENAQK